MPRSKWKPPYVDIGLLRKVKKQVQTGKHGVIKTYARNSQILPGFVGHTFYVHNGRVFVPVKVTEEMVGHKFGEFALTRTFRGHPGDKKATKKQ